MFKHCYQPSTLACALLCCAMTTAAQNRELASEATGHRYIFYSPDKVPTIQVDEKSSLRLSTSPRVNRLTVMDYTLNAELIEQSNTRKSAHEGARWSGETERGTTRYIPRFVLAARNKPVEIGTIMVVEYFSRDLADKKNIKREAVEHIPLVLTPKGQTIVFDGAGVDLFKVEQKASNLAGRRSNSRFGKEFMGIIVSLFHSGNLLFQQYSESDLSKLCVTNMPTAQAHRQPQPDKRAPAWRRQRQP